MGTLTPSAKTRIKQFWSEEKENNKLKPTWEMSCLLLQKEKWTGTVSIYVRVFGGCPEGPSVAVTCECTGSFQSGKHRPKDVALLQGGC